MIKYTYTHLFQKIEINNINNTFKLLTIKCLITKKVKKACFQKE